MNLYFRKMGEGKPLIVLHGVFGSSDNLFTVCKKISEEGFEVYTLDARNHGQSDQSDDFNYQVMAADLDSFLTEHNIIEPIIMGHSMGGKTVMEYGMNYTNFSKLIIIDIASRFYPMHHNHILEGLNAIKLEELKSRKDAEDVFSNYVSDFGERQFLLKNLYRNEEGGFSWRFNLPVLTSENPEVGKEIEFNKIVDKPVLLIRGSESGYVKEADFEEFKKGFPNAVLRTIEGANHWVHATKPEEFVEAVLAFSNN